MAELLVRTSIGIAATTSIQPPFSQCPHVGGASTCGILIVVNADRTASVYGDGNVGPYDGADDTLVGVVNDSSQAVSAITVTGPTGLGSLDGDGLCTYGVTGCPYGSTGYEGPGTSLVTDPTVPNSAEIDFASAGLGSGASTYFSLEGALTAATLTARQGHLSIGRYVALGDSFSAGEGAVTSACTGNGCGDPSYANFDPATNTSANQCHRSFNAYGSLIKGDRSVQDKDFIFRACSGAIMADFVANLGQAGQWTDGPQLDAIAPANNPSQSTGLITLSVGGNDVGFPFILDKCVHGFAHPEGNDASCQRAISNYYTRGAQLLSQGGTILVNRADNSFTFCDALCQKANKLISLGGVPLNGLINRQVVTVPSLSGLYQAIHQRAPKARIRVLLYPHLFPAAPQGTCVVGGFSTLGHSFQYTLSLDEMVAVNKKADDLDALIQSQVDIASGHGIDVATIDARPAFSPLGPISGHTVCTPTPWLNGLILNSQPFPSPSVFSFHPNAVGQRNFADEFESAL
jgi:lysophospholipase L1-like esterase